MRSAFLVCLFFTFRVQINAQSPEVLVYDAKAKYKSILLRLDKFDSTEVAWQSADQTRNQIIGYYEKDSLMLLHEVCYNDVEQKQSYICFDKGLVFLIVNLKEIYNRPIYYDKKVAKENNDSIVFDPAKSTFKEMRYYFSKERLFRFATVNKRGEEVEESIAPNTNTALELIKFAHTNEKVLAPNERHKKKRL